MLLTPQHFQQLDNYYENLFSTCVNSFSPFGWGLSAIQINLEGLSNNQFILQKCSGIFPNGLPFNIPEDDEPPSYRSIEGHFESSALSQDVFLALAMKRPGSPNVKLESGETARPARYQARMIGVSDEVTGENKLELAFAGMNLKILFGDEASSDYETIKIAELKRTEQGLITLEETYIPPLISFSASKYLSDMIIRLLEILHTKSASLSETRGQRTRHIAEFTTGEVTNFWLLHTVNSYIPWFEHFSKVRRAHPEQIFLVMSQLAGELTTFSTDITPRDLPSYNHLALSQPFVKLDEIIQMLLKVQLHTGAIQIPLKRETESKFTAQILDDQLLIDSQIFLAANAEVAEQMLVGELPKQTKISSVDKIESLLGLALPGVPLVPVSIPPSPLRIKLGYHFFRLESRGGVEIKPHWDDIRNSRSLAIRVTNPKRFVGLKLELWSVKEEAMR